jgi:hypothetical protein
MNLLNSINRLLYNITSLKQNNIGNKLNKEYNIVKVNLKTNKEMIK